MFAKKVFNKTIIAMCRILAKHWRVDLSEESQIGLFHFICMEYMQLPSYYRFAIYILTLCFSLTGVFYGLVLFHQLDKETQKKQLITWQQSSFAPASLLIQFFQSLVLLKIFSPPNNPKQSAKAGQASDISNGLISLPTKNTKTEVAIIGSGPGGAITAALLAEAGFEVLLIEEGGLHQAGQYAPFSAAEFSHLFRYGGLGIMLGATPISYLEGRCVGGGSAVNSGLYLRPMAQVLEQWHKKYDLKNCSITDLKPFLRVNEAELKVSLFQGEQPAAGLKLAAGAKVMDWSCVEVEKWRSYAIAEIWSDNSRLPYQTMNNSFMPRFIKVKGQILAQRRVASIKSVQQAWQLKLENSQNKTDQLNITAKHVFICAGAVQTPALLRRSQMTHNIGNNLQSSLIIKVIARFAEPINFENMGMPVQQVREFAPQLSFGCAISNKSQLALGLQSYPELSFDLNKEWPYLACYSVILAGVSRGKVRNLKANSWVYYAVKEQDWLALGQGLKQLMELLLAAQAVELYPVMKLNQAIRNSTEIQQLPDNIAPYKPQISSIHLSSSCPMGENPSICATDSYGKVRGHKNLYINDASLLCSYPGANPQASIMAIARRNVENFIDEHARN